MSVVVAYYPVLLASVYAVLVWSRQLLFSDCQLLCLYLREGGFEDGVFVCVV